MYGAGCVSLAITAILWADALHREPSIKTTIVRDTFIK
jgi:hypothetical protein